MNQMLFFISNSLSLTDKAYSLFTESCLSKLTNFFFLCEDNINLYIVILIILKYGYIFI